MKKIGIVIFSIFLINGLKAQDCDNTFESNYLNLSICNDLKWKIEQSLPYIKIKTPDVATFITIFSEPYDGNETFSELSEKSFNAYQKVFAPVEKINEEKLDTNGIAGKLYTVKLVGKPIQKTTFIMVNRGRKYIINNNCYSNCENSELAVKNVINKTTFQKIEEPKLTKDELKGFEKFKIDLHTAFQSGKVKSFEKLLVNQSLMLKLFETKLKDETMKQRFSTIIKTNWEEFSKDFVVESKESFEKLMVKGKEIGINWKKTKLVGVEYKLESEIPGIISAKCVYRFSFQGKKYKITIKSVEPLKEGWFISKMKTSLIKEE